MKSTIPKMDSKVKCLKVTIGTKRKKTGKKTELKKDMKSSIVKTKAEVILMM